MEDLKTEYGRLMAILEIENSFMSSLRKIGIELSEDANCNVHDRSIKLGLMKKSTESRKGFFIKDSSSVDLIANFTGKIGYLYENKINFGTSGAFTSNDKENYWRIIHAASILKNWDAVSEIVNNHCKMYSALCEEIINQNK
jgi:hypothetical protein